VPRPTKAMLAQNKAEEDARKHESMTAAVMDVVGRHPDVSSATTVGDPTLQDQDLVDPGRIVKAAIAGAGKPASGKESLSVQTANVNPGANQPAPRSDTPPAENSAVNDETNPLQPAQTDSNELKPAAAAANSESQPPVANDPNELKPNVAQDAPPAQAPAQVNEIQAGDPAPQTQPSASTGGGNPSVADGQQLANDSDLASSKHKKKKGLHKIIPSN
jgi:hypothetical protein